MVRKIGIGLDNFSEIIRNNCFYVDKTFFIREWWENFDKATLITRPRRFGKTLTMSMVEQFFSVRYAGQGELFAGLSIWQDEKYRSLQGTYPVISLSFANVKETNYADARSKICQILVNLFQEYSFLLESDVLGEKDRQFFDQVAPDMDELHASLAIQQLSRYLYLYYGKKVILLLDEYDTPMQEAYLSGYWEELTTFIRNMFNASFKTNAWLERAIMTGIACPAPSGITRVSRESVFSDLNHLEVIATISEKYETAFGFTEDEVFASMDEFGIGQKENVKRWYDGFTFGKQGDIYNPWSIINFLGKKQFLPYWANTSSNRLVNNLIRRGSKEIKMIMEDLLERKTLYTQMDEQIVYSELDEDENVIWSFLLAGGYLKVVSYKEDSVWGEHLYELALTNLEVQIMFKKMIHGWFHKCLMAYNDFIQALLSDDLDGMNEYMNRIAIATFSSFDSGRKTSELTEPERFYHGFVLGLMVDLNDRYTITSNRESGLGRYDVALKKREGEREAFIMEFKVRRKSDRSLEDTAKAALGQIIDRKYSAELEQDGVPLERIRIYGFAFEGKKIFIDGGYVQSYSNRIYREEKYNGRN